MNRITFQCSNVIRTLAKGNTFFLKTPNILFSSLSNSNKDYIRPRRAILYVPGHDQRKIEKVRSVDVDCAVLDCEDGVALNKKSEARRVISEIDDAYNFGRSEYAVRVNSIGSGLAEDDLRTILSGKRIPDTLMFPKVENINHVSWIYDKLKTYFKNKCQRKLSLIFFIESAESLLNLKEICEKSISTGNEQLKLEGLVFGSDDFCADIGATRTTEGLELLTARQLFVMVAKCFRLQAIDMVHINYKDLESLSKVAEAGAQMGFTGKQVIHPAQVPIVQKAFSPSEDSLKWAKELIKEFELHQKEGKGAFTFKGAMIDKPLLLQAQNIVKISSMEPK